MLQVDSVRIVPGQCMVFHYQVWRGERLRHLHFVLALPDLYFDTIHMNTFIDLSRHQAWINVSVGVCSDMSRHQVIVLKDSHSISTILIFHCNKT